MQNRALSKTDTAKNGGLRYEDMKPILEVSNKVTLE